MLGGEGSFHTNQHSRPQLDKAFFFLPLVRQTLKPEDLFTRTRFVSHNKVTKTLAHRFQVRRKESPVLHNKTRINQLKRKSL